MNTKIAWLSGYPAHYMRTLHTELEKKYSERLHFFYLHQQCNLKRQRSYEKGALPSFSSIYGSSSVFRFLRLIIDIINHSPDVIVMSGHHPKPILLAGIIFILLGKKVCYWSDTNIYDIWQQNNILRFFKKIIFSLILKRMTHIMYMGNANRDFYISIIGRTIFDRKKIFVPYPHDHEKFVSIYNRSLPKDTRDGTFNLISVSRLIKVKLINNVVEGIALLPDKIKYKIKYTIVGTGPEKAKIKELIKNYKLEKVVIMVGSVNSNDIPSYILLSDMLILPSDYEPWGLVVNEAMSLAVPVVAPYWVGASQNLIINGYTGVLLDGNTPAHISKTIEFAVANPQYLKYLSSNCIKHIENHRTCLSESLSNTIIMFEQLNGN
jgi:glycosyltransferase involved in cell wall biosynthesis